MEEQPQQNVEALNPEHPMVDFAQKNSAKLLMMTIWQARRVYPDLSVKITLKDMQEFTRMFGQGAQRPTMAVIGKRDYVELRIVDEQTGRMLLVEQGDPNHPSAVMQRESMEVRKKADRLRERLLEMAETLGSPRKRELVKEAEDAIRLLTWEPEA